jgi:selenide,water dikinase
MTAGSRVRAEISVAAVPVLPLVKDMIMRNVIPAGRIPIGSSSRRTCYGTLASLQTPAEQVILCDAQTSGGLLIALAPEFADEMLTKLHSAGVSSAVKIGQIIPGSDGKIKVVP